MIAILRWNRAVNEGKPHNIHALIFKTYTECMIYLWEEWQLREDSNNTVVVVIKCILLYTALRTWKQPKHLITIQWNLILNVSSRCEFVMQSIESENICLWLTALQQKFIQYAPGDCQLRYYRSLNELLIFLQFQSIITD